MYTVPLSAVNGLSRLTKLTTSKGAGRHGRFEFESNLEASQPRRSLVVVDSFA